MESRQALTLIKENKADFGFVTERVSSPHLIYREFCDEEYILVSSSPHDFDNLDQEAVFKKTFVSYSYFDRQFSLWNTHNFPENYSASAASLNIRNRFNWIDGAIKMVAGGLGISIFPRHTVQHLIDNKILFEFKGNKGPIFNTIYINQHIDAQKNAHIKLVIDWFMEMTTKTE